MTWFLQLASRSKKTSGNLFFHAFSGCDVVSVVKERSLHGKHGICAVPTVGDDDLEVPEKNVITMYDRSSITTSVNYA